MIEKIIELIEQKNFKELKALLKDANESDIAEVLNDLDPEDTEVVFRLLGKEEAVDIFARMDSDQQEHLIEILSDKELSAMVTKMSIDDAADLVEEMPANLVTRILKNTNPIKRKVINEILKYPEDSAGSIMTVEYVAVKSGTTVKQTIDILQKSGINKETIYTIYVIDQTRKLLGVIVLKDLLQHKSREKVDSFMEENVISVNTNEDKEEVAKMFDKYDFLAMPVVDTENRLVGIVTYDDAIDVLSEESEEDFEKMAAMKPTEEDYMKSSIFSQYKNRIVWLLILMLSSIITGKIISGYEDAFKAIPILVSFIPMIMDTGGNCGSQASTMVIRAIATDEVELKDFLKVWWKEARIAILVGLTLGVVNGLRVGIQYQDATLGLVIGMTLLCTAILAKSIGCLLPILAKACGFDPAYMASPMITTIVDACSLAIFFNCALLLLAGRI